MSKIAWITLLIIGFIGGILFSRYDVPFIIVIAAIVLSFYSLKNALIIALILSIFNELNIGFGIGSGITAFLVSAFVVVVLTRFIKSQNILVRFFIYLFNILLATILYYLIIEFRYSLQIGLQTIDFTGLLLTTIVGLIAFIISAALVTESKSSYYEVKE